MSDLAKSMRAALDAGDMGATLSVDEMLEVVRLNDEIERLRARLTLLESAAKDAGFFVVYGDGTKHKMGPKE